MNSSHSLYAYETQDPKSQENQLTPQSLERKGAIDIAKALWGKYTDVQGHFKSVGGCVTKVRYVLGLSSAAQPLFNKFSHTTRKIPRAR